jgi:ABC-type Zn uptake system ZnuABC Zn-binding protein ZnuA
MAALDGKNADFFRANARTFEARIDKKMAEWTAKMKPFENAKIASYHATFNYFHKRFGLTSIGYLEDRPGIPPSPAHLVELIRQMKTEKVPVIFHESFYDHSTSDMVATKTGARVLILPTSVGGTKSAASYEALIDTLVGEFVNAMKKAKP